MTLCVTLDSVSDENEMIIKIAIENGAVATKTCGAGRGAVALFAKDIKDRIEFIMH